MRESYVEGTTFSGGLPPYVSNRLVDMMIENDICWFYVEVTAFSEGVLHMQTE